MQKEAAWAINNLFSGGSVSQRNHLYDYGVFEPYCNLLLANDGRMIEIILDGLYHLLNVRCHICINFLSYIF